MAYLCFTEIYSYGAMCMYLISSPFKNYVITQKSFLLKSSVVSVWFVHVLINAEVFKVGRSR